MKAKTRIIPLYFTSATDQDFTRQLQALETLLEDEAQFLYPAPLGGELPEADAVLFPQMLGDAYRKFGCPSS